MTNFPVGLMCTRVVWWNHSAGITGLMIRSMTASYSSFCAISGACCVDRTIASTAAGLPSR